MDDPEAKILSSKYFEPRELTPLLKNKESFFHLNISSFPFHFEEFSTLVSTYKHFVYLSTFPQKVVKEERQYTFKKF